MWGAGCSPLKPCRLPPNQLFFRWAAGLPNWARGTGADHYAVIAKSERTPTTAQLREMLQHFLVVVGRPIPAGLDPLESGSAG